MKELIVLMAWHQESDQAKCHAFEENKRSFITHNPELDILTIMNPFSDQKEAWLGTDLAIFEWYQINRDKYVAKRYLIVEWDCWCDCNLTDYFSRVWDCDLVVPNIKYPERDDWYWFNTLAKLPASARLHATGITPLCGILLSKVAMDAIGQEILKPEYGGLNSELRLGTIATMLNYDPIVNPVYNRSLGWRATGLFDTKYKGLHHPRKKI